ECGGREATRHSNTLLRELTDHLAKGRVLAADLLDVVHAQLFERKNPLPYSRARVFHAEWGVWWVKGAPKACCVESKRGSGCIEARGAERLQDGILARRSPISAIRRRVRWGRVLNEGKAKEASRAFAA